jgi:hypothetical protein
MNVGAAKMNADRVRRFRDHRELINNHRRRRAYL